MKVILATLLLLAIVAPLPSPSLVTGGKIPSLALQGLNSMDHLLVARFQNKATLVLLFPNQCVNCQKLLNEVHTAQRSAGTPLARFYGVYVGDWDDYHETAKKSWSLRFPALHDAGKRYWQQVGRPELPAILIVDTKGRLVNLTENAHRNSGWKPGWTKALNKAKQQR